MKPSSALVRVARGAALSAALVLGAVACGNLDDVTTVKDLRVLAARSEPAGYLVSLDDPASLGDTMPTITALVVDPKGNSATLTYTGQACPDELDTITAASGKSTSLCPPAVAQDLPPGMAMPVAPSTIEYNPQVSLTLPSAILKTVFALPGPNDPPLAPAMQQAVQYNRDFGFDAIVDLDFVLGMEKASLIKRVVYWPLLPDALLPVQDPAMPDPNCPTKQVANQNPTLATVDLYQHRVLGDPMDLWADATPTLSIAAKNELYVQPTYDPSAAENYFLRVNKSETEGIETQCRHEQLTFQFYATAGTFDPALRASDPSAFMAAGSTVHLDSQYKLPTVADLPADGKVTIWVVVHDERAGQSWMSRTIVVTP
jgi:hypothetical protein